MTMLDFVNTRTIWHANGLDNHDRVDEGVMALFIFVLQLAARGACVRITVGRQCRRPDGRFAG